jgi:hypothetical protein
LYGLGAFVAMAIYNVKRPDGSNVPYNAKSMAEVTRRTLLCFAVVLCWFIGTERAGAATIADALFFDDDPDAAMYDSGTVVGAPPVPVVGTLAVEGGLVPCADGYEPACFNVSPVGQPLDVPDYFVDATGGVYPGLTATQYFGDVGVGSVGWLKGTEPVAKVFCGDYPTAQPLDRKTLVVFMDDTRGDVTPDDGVDNTTVNDNAFYAVRFAGIIPPCPASVLDGVDPVARSVMTTTIARTTSSGTLIRWGQTWRAYDTVKIRRNGDVIKRKTWDHKLSMGPHSWTWYHDTLRRGRYSAQVCGKAAGQNQCRIVKRWRKR